MNLQEAIKLNFLDFYNFLRKTDRGGQGREVQALQEGADQAAKPGSVWPGNTDILLPKLSNNRCSWQDYPAAGGGG